MTLIFWKAILNIEGIMGFCDDNKLSFSIPLYLLCSSEVLKMEGKRFIFFCLTLLMITASWVPSSRAAEDLICKEIVASKDSISSERVSNQGIKCNWTGWRNSHPGIKCRPMHCSSRMMVISMNCSEGFLTEMRTKRICVACKSER